MTYGNGKCNLNERLTFFSIYLHCVPIILVFCTYDFKIHIFSEGSMAFKINILDWSKDTFENAVRE
jgi:hypothetical protein